MMDTTGSGSHDRSEPAAVILEVFARPDVLADVRKLIERLATKTPLTRPEVDEILTVAVEAVANAIRHGSPQGERSLVTVVCYPMPNGLLVEVRDTGAGFTVPSAPASMPDPDAPGGRGLPLMCALADSVEFSSTSKGTTVTLKKSARR